MYFRVMLHSLSKMALRFTILSQVSVFIADVIVPLWDHHSVAVHPLDRLLGCFQFLAMMNQTATSILYKPFYGHALSFLLGK